jgi:leader peptidase (prepilin peptidase)/N-methyltransferase
LEYDAYLALPPELARFWTVATFIFGACLGSFLNVCIWRIPRGESVVSPPSRCPNCGHQITWYENIPLFSWIFLLGRCSGCKKPISARYFVVELITGFLFSLLFLKVLASGEPLERLAPYYLMTALALTTAFIDCELRIIPDKTTYPAIAASLLMAPLLPEAWGTHSRLWAFAIALSGLLLAGGLMALASILGRLAFKRDALGWGDVKYIAAVGACLGFVPALFALFAGSVLGSLFGLSRHLFNSKRRRRPIAFGPFLAGGVLLWMLFGAWLLALYHEKLRLLTLP